MTNEPNQPTDTKPLRHGNLGHRQQPFSTALLGSGSGSHQQSRLATACLSDTPPRVDPPMHRLRPALCYRGGVPVRRIHRFFRLER